MENISPALLIAFVTALTNLAAEIIRQIRVRRRRRLRPRVTPPPPRRLPA